MDAKKLVVSLGNDNAKNWLLYQSGLVHKHLPDYEYFVYDIGGLNWKAVREINKVGHVIDWNSIEQGHTVFWNNEHDPHFRRSLRNPIITLSSLKKAWCIRDVILRFRKSPLIQLLYLDADAFPIRPLGNVWEHGFNLAVTLRKPYSVSLNLQKVKNPMYYRFKLLNAGVQMYQGTPKKLINLIDLYINRFLLDKKNIADQTALNRLVDLCEEFDWTSWEKNYTLKSDNDDFIVRVMACKIYNWFTKADRAPGPEVKIVHAKGTYKRNVKTVNDVPFIIDRRRQNYLRKRRRI